MQIFKLVILGLVTLMSLAAGAAKVRQLPQEAMFFEGLGINAIWMIVLGIIQIAGAGLGAFEKTRRLGAFIMALAFLVSTVMIFMSGNNVLGGVSLIAVVLACLLAWPEAPKRSSGKA